MDTTMDDSVAIAPPDADTRNRRSAAPDRTERPTRKRGARRPIIILAGLGIVAVAGYLIHMFLTRNEEGTDDAQVEADVVPLAAQIGGRVIRSYVHDNESVHAGDLLLLIDPRETQAKLDQARAALTIARSRAREADAQVALAEATARGGLHSAEATVSSAADELRRAEAGIAAAQAGVDRARAQAEIAATTLARDRALRDAGAIAQAEFDAAQSANEAAQAAVAQAEAQLRTASAARLTAQSQIGAAQGRLEQSAPVGSQLEAAQARATLAHAQVDDAEAAVRLAELQRSYAEVRAPRDGYVSNLSVFEGQLLQSGQPVAELVPNETYVVANFKETQIGRMRPGQRAEIRIDAFGRRTFRGRVVSLSGGTGARFALLPPDNASGNFVKVVQRVPVRIAFERLPPGVRPQAGLSADVTVHFDR